MIADERALILRSSLGKARTGFQAVLALPSALVTSL